jgi:hypothetical protein
MHVHGGQFGCVPTNQYYDMKVALYIWNIAAADAPLCTF